jgi:hypothetical protein
VLDPGSFSALVKALETANHGRTRTMPRLLWRNHQAAELKLGPADALREHERLEHGRDHELRGTRTPARRSRSRRRSRGRPDPARLHDQLSSFVGSPSNPNLRRPGKRTSSRARATVPDGFTVVVGGVEIQSESDDRTKDAALR